MKELRNIGILVLIIGSVVAFIGGLLASKSEDVTEAIITGLVAFTGGLIAGIGGYIISLASRK